MVFITAILSQNKDDIMLSNNEITLSDLHEQSEDIETYQSNIKEMPYREQLENINHYLRRIHITIERGYDNLHRDLNSLSGEDFPVDILKYMQSGANELYAINHHCYNAMEINELTERNSNYIHKLSELINEYTRQLEQLKKMTSVHTGNDHTDDTIDMLNKKINDLRHTVSDAVRFAILLSKINMYMLNTLSVTGFWVQLMALYEPYFKQGAPMDGLNDIIQHQLDYFNSFGH
ncbi:hypothetical protein [Morganella morganii]|uniref:hypothetical protein n=3 Tax=Morganella morganii TaxID=582 RepID=UPI001BDA8320|nr:hypothetical protein [Morganella morganii]MBT0519248.1 hypothetical protein [Morganella morganii subsp. morganii]QWL88372.1 hypothetical protein IZ187_12385 [Morganella morganii subsp. morganii]